MVTFDLVLPTVVSTVEGWDKLTSCAKCCVVRDLEGRVRLVLEPVQNIDVDPAPLEALLKSSLDGWFAGPILTTCQPRERRALAKELLQKAAPWTTAEWNDGAGTPHQPAAPGRWYLLERRLSKFDWLTNTPGGAIWPLGTPAAPAVVTFFSFKGGVGRTTLLTACAWQLARLHQKRVVAIDLDLEAPGLGLLLGAEGNRGVLDFIVDELAVGGAELEPLPAQALGPTDAALVDVVPAGRLDLAYLEKLSRLDFTGGGGFLQDGSPPIATALRALLNKFRGKGYDFVLLDARAGMHDIAGLSLHGLAHVDVLVSRASEQAYRGLELTIEALARRRSAVDLMTLNVHSMVPAEQADATAEKARFRQRSYDMFKRHLYDDYGEDTDVPQEDDADEPHTPYPISRHPKLETIESAAFAEEELFSAEYVAVTARIVALCTVPDDDEKAQKVGA